jgi:hypothetical protein
MKSKLQSTVGRLERFPVTWNHVTDKKSLQINKLEHVLIVQMILSERDMLKRFSCFSTDKWIRLAGYG